MCFCDIVIQKNRFILLTSKTLSFIMTKNDLVIQYHSKGEIKNDSDNKNN